MRGKDTADSAVGQKTMPSKEVNKMYGNLGNKLENKFREWEKNIAAFDEDYEED